MIKNLQFLFGVKETVYEFWLGPGQQEEKRKGQGCKQEQATDAEDGHEPALFPNACVLLVLFLRLRFPEPPAGFGWGFCCGFSWGFCCGFCCRVGWGFYYRFCWGFCCGFGRGFC